MTEPRRRKPFAALQRLAQLATPAVEAVQERCDLCSEPIPLAHRHLLEVSARQVQCACRACSLLFDQVAASRGKYRLIPERCLSLEDFQISDAQWESLQIPVGMAFFCYSTPAQRIVACYPSPMGATEALLELRTWGELEESNPMLKALQHDVEALLVNRARGGRQYFVVPIDECYKLVGIIRIHWKGLGGGPVVWQEIGHFFAALKERSQAMRRQDCAPAHLEKNEAAGEEQWQSSAT